MMTETSVIFNKPTQLIGQENFINKCRVFESRVLRIFWYEREKVMGGWRKFHNEELFNLYFSPNNIRMLESRAMCWVVWKDLKARDHLENLGVDGRITLEWLLEVEWEGMDWIHLAHGADQLQLLLNTVMNIRFP
jgi:hypothetical protein